jgi:hypothetical protein
MKEFASMRNNVLVVGVILIAALATGGAIMLCPASAAEPVVSAPPGEGWLELAVGANEDALSRHFNRATLLAQIQALIWDKPAAGQKAPLDVLDGTLMVRRGQRMWLDLRRVEKDTAATLRSLAATKEPKNRLDLETELQQYTAKVYYEKLVSYRTSADLLREHPYRDNSEYLVVPVDSDFLACRRVLHVAKDRVADALAAYADQADRIIYPAGTAFIAEAKDAKGGLHSTEVLLKRPDGYWTAMIFDGQGQLVPQTSTELGGDRGTMTLRASTSCHACHRISRDLVSTKSGFNYLELMPQLTDSPWPEQVHLGPEYRERAAFDLTETVLRQRDGVFGPYASLLLSELIYKQKHGTLNDADRRRYQRLQPHFPRQLPPLAKKQGGNTRGTETDRIAEQPATSPETPEGARQRHAKVAERHKAVDVICHRGASEFAHENTLEAYRATFELGGDGNEIDIRATKDGVLVLFHDDMLDQLLEAYGDVSDYTWEELQRFRFRNPGRFGAQCRIPTLAEVFDMHRQYGGLLHLDIKRPGLDRAIAELLTRMDMWDHVAYCNVDNAGIILRDPRLRLLRYKAPGLYEDRSEVFPDAIAAALKKPGDGVIVDDPRGVAVALGRKLGKLSKEPVSPREVLPRNEEAKLPSAAELIALLRKADDWDRVAETAADKAASGQRIRARAEAAEQLLATKASSREAFAALEERVRKRSLHKDWLYHGLDGAMALRSLILLRAPNAVETARFALWRDDPALDLVIDPRWKNPRAWTDFRVKMVIWPALEKCPGPATEKLCRDYLALNDEDARKLGPPQFGEAAKALLAVSPRTETALELMKHRLQVVRGQAILDCLAHAKESWARAALEKGAPHALALRADD